MLRFGFLRKLKSENYCGQNLYLRPYKHEASLTGLINNLRATLSKEKLLVSELDSRAAFLNRRARDGSWQIFNGSCKAFRNNINGYISAPIDKKLNQN